MTSTSPEPPSILPCGKGERAAALELVFRDLAEPVRNEQVKLLLAEAETQPVRLSGLFIARERTGLEGAILARSLAGKAAHVWPPRLVAGCRSEIAEQLLSRALSWCDDFDVTLAQALPAAEAEEDHARLLRAGFDRLAELLYLVCGTAHLPHAAPDDELEFESYCAGNHDRLKEIIRQSYEASLDCPAIDGVRDLEDVLAGYRATGVFDPSRWFIVRQHDRDIGCLLLAGDAQHAHWELVYMGVAPHRRGHGIGLKIVRHAQWLAWRAGQQGVVLSVDAQNEPAIQMYDEAGFTIWERRPVFVKILRPPTIRGARSKNQRSAP